LRPRPRALGFPAEPVSGCGVSVDGIPAESWSDAPAERLAQLIEQVRSARGSLRSERHATLAHGMARSAMNQPPRTLKLVEMHDLIDRLFACEMPYFTPGGKPVVITYGIHELDERFAHG